MTPKEKAQELLNKFIQTNGNAFFAKACALIVVDEIIELLPEIAFGMRVIGYYQQVREEIEKL